MLQAALTLPGIAGIVLTIGMAVDANVLINERIREELRNGKTPQAAIHAGYDKAFATIVDSNLTTLIAGLVLFAFGSGPDQGLRRGPVPRHPHLDVHRPDRDAGAGERHLRRPQGRAPRGLTAGRTGSTVEFFSKKTNIDFLGRRKAAFLFSPC